MGALLLALGVIAVGCAAVLAWARSEARANRDARAFEKELQRRRAIAARGECAFSP